MENINPTYWSKKNKPITKKFSSLLVCFLFLIMVIIFSYFYSQEKSQLSALKIKYDESMTLTQQLSKPIKNPIQSGSTLFSDTLINNIKLIGIIKENEKCWVIFSNNNDIQKALKNDILSKDNYIISSINDSSVILKQKNKPVSITMGFL